MKRSQRNTQLTLIITGFFLILSTYFIYPYLDKDKSEDQSIVRDRKEKIDGEKNSFFENVEYKCFYNVNTPFSIKSKEALILQEEPNVLYMTDVHVILYLNDGRVVNLTSDKGRYNKKTFDFFLEENVSATDEETIIFAKNLDMLASDNSVKIYNDVYLDYVTGSLKADKIDYDFNTKYFKVSMFDSKRIKMKVIKWAILKNLEL